MLAQTLGLLSVHTPKLMCLSTAPMASIQAKIWGVASQVGARRPHWLAGCWEHGFHFLFCLTTVDSNELTVIWTSGSESGLPCGPDV